MIRSFQFRFLTPAIAALVLAGCLNGMPQEDLMHVDCLTAPDPGPCKGAFPGFYYDYQLDRCQRFTYGGCDGSRPFESMNECVKACGAKAGP